MKSVFSLVCMTFVLGVTTCFGAANTEGTSAPGNVVVGKAVWLTSLAEAKAEAAKRKVPILADFSGSDWCGWCIKLDKEVFSTPAFQKYASENLVLLLLDFPRAKPQTDEIKKQNAGLSDKFGIEGLPTVILMNSEGHKLAQTGYLAGGGEVYVTHLQKLLKNK